MAPLQEANYIKSDINPVYRVYVFSHSLTFHKFCSQVIWPCALVTTHISCSSSQLVEITVLYMD